MFDHDAQKNAVNPAKHGIDFGQAPALCSDEQRIKAGRFFDLMQAQAEPILTAIDRPMRHEMERADQGDAVHNFIA